MESHEIGRGLKHVVAEGTRLAQPGEETAKEVTDCCHQLPQRDY